MIKTVIYFKSGRKEEVEGRYVFDQLRESFNVWRNKNSVASFTWFDDAMFSLHEIEQIRLIDALPKL